VSTSDATQAELLAELILLARLVLHVGSGRTDVVIDSEIAICVMIIVM
jgi:hypothetical protein